MTLLQLEHFTCNRNAEPLFSPIQYHLNAGEIVQVIGPNGAGKTTLLRTLCGLYSDYSGSITWRGQPHRPQSFGFQQQLLYLGHHTGVKKALTAQENLESYFGWQGMAPAQPISNLLAKVGLAGYEHTLCSELSAGQMRRVALARLYGAAHCALWVLDEPFTAIDVQGVTALERLLQNHCQQGGSVILTTHQAMQLACVSNWHLHPVVEEYP